jgi:hypothetical protein
MEDGDIVNLKIFRTGNVLINEFNLPVNPSDKLELTEPHGSAPKIKTKKDILQLKATILS